MPHAVVPAPHGLDSPGHVGGTSPGKKGNTGRSWIRLPRLSTLMRTFAGLILVCVTVAAMVYGKEPLAEMLTWLESHNNTRGMVTFIIVEAIAVALLLPAVPLIIAAGVVFGFTKGTMCVWCAASIGQIGAFLLSRYLLRDFLVALMQKRFSEWEALDKAIQVEGWKLILLLRASPLVPYSVLNVLLGSSSITFRTFAFFSTIGIIPECMITVYFGTLAGNIANVVNGRAGPQGPAKLILIIAGGVTMLLAAGYAGYVAKKAIRRAVSRSHGQGCAPDSEEHADGLAESEAGSGSLAQTAPGTNLPGVLLRATGGMQSKASVDQLSSLVEDEKRV
mmetsp:Transcript_40674/g.115124  ORF Transcript_40674/g.115124 Transcript_40674/m.115124 type:complete len:335 (+) Transcript_40674:191-1195(+)